MTTPLLQYKELGLLAIDPMAVVISQVSGRDKVDVSAYQRVFASKISLGLTHMTNNHAYQPVWCSDFQENGLEWSTNVRTEALILWSSD